MRVDPATLREYLAALPDGFPLTVPKEFVLELLGGPNAPHPTAPAAAGAEADLTVQDIATRFGRDTSTIRLWIKQGRFPGAYRFQRREWRVPAAALSAFEEAERQRAPNDESEEAGAVRRAPMRKVELSAWRRRA